jgi:hypothetical protein
VANNAATTTEPAVPDTPAVEVQTTLMQVVTDDPNIVIYWLIDQSGGQ